MFWRKKKNREDQTPWYRRRDYKGDLTEDEKRELDHYRWLAQQPGGKHPAAEQCDLPEEVQRYVRGLEFELQDERGKRLMSRVLFFNGIGVFVLLIVFFGRNPVSHEDSTLMFLLGVFSGVFWIVIAWLDYFREAKKLGDQLMGDEGIRFKWETNYIASKRTESGAPMPFLRG